jgi:hypothetical protein
MNSPASCPGTGRPLRPQHRLPDPPSPFNTQSATRPPAPARSASRVTSRHAMSASGHAYVSCVAPALPSTLSRSAWGPRHETLKSMLQERCRPLAQSGVIKAPRIQLENGLLRTKQKPTLLPTLRYYTKSRGQQKVSYPAGRHNR